MLKVRRHPTTPGEILKEDYLTPRGITVTALARALGVSRKHASNIIGGQARLDAEIACKLAALFGTTSQFWLNLQNAVDLYRAETALKRSWKPTLFKAPDELRT